jgi:hippurate hydrolase
VFVAVQVAQGLQGIVTRSKKPVDAAVLSITMIHAGDATNVVPDVATISGTVRTFDEAVTDLIEERLRRITIGTAEAHGAKATVEFVRNYPPTVNHAREAEYACAVLDDIVGAENVLRECEPTMGAEDFSFLLQARPGAFIFIGNGDGGHRAGGHGLGPCTLHNASYDFNDDLLALGATFWIRLVERFLARA